MRFVIALAHLGFFRHYDGVIRHLADRGHQVYLRLHQPQKRYLSDRALRSCLRRNPEISFGPLHRGLSGWRRLVGVTRDLLSYTVYLGPNHPAPLMGRRWRGYLPLPLRLLAGLPGARRLLRNEGIREALRTVDQRVRPDPAILKWLRQVRPHLVLAAPCIMPRSREIEYVKAARWLELPTVVAVPSWDNLTSKGTLPMVPDRLMLWNGAMAAEARRIHGIPTERIVVTGAPFFDPYFGLSPSMRRPDLCVKLRIDPDRPYLAYLCSSGTITGNETGFFKRFLTELRCHPRTRDMSVVVRPHPITAPDWKNFGGERVTVFPRDGEVPDVPEARQAMFDLLSHAVAAVGINTSATLEAAIADRPCVTIMTPEHHAGQEGTGHFRHLIDTGFLETARSLEEAAALIGSIRDGRDSLAVQRRRFVRSFLRPHGLEAPASRIMAEAIEAAARELGPPAACREAAGARA